MRTYSLTCTLLFCAGIAGTVCAENFVPNGRFESGLWDTDHPQQAVFDSQDGQGRKVLKLVGGKQGVSLRTEIQPPVHGRKYRVSARIRTWQLKDNALYVMLFVREPGKPAKVIGQWYKEIGQPGFVDPLDTRKGVLLAAGGSWDWRELYTTLARLPEAVDRDKAQYYVELGLKPNSVAGPRSDTQRLDQEYGWLGAVAREAAGKNGVAWIDEVRIEDVGAWPEPAPCKGEIDVKGEIGGVSYFHGRDAEIEFKFKDFDPETMQAAYRIHDGWAILVADDRFVPVKNADGEFAYTLQRGGVGHFDIQLLIRKDGREYIADATGYGVLTKEQSNYYKADVHSPFGLWLVAGKPVEGDMTFRDIGVKWTSGSLTWNHWKWQNDRWEQYTPEFAQIEVGRFRPQNIHYYASCIIRGTPKHLSSNPDAANFLAYPPKKLSDMDALIERNVEVHEGYPTAWGALNETNYEWCWLAGMDELVKVHRHFYEKCKQLDPDCIVLGPTAGSWNVGHVERFFKAGGYNTVDEVDIHFNTQAGDMEVMDFVGRLRELKATMRAHGGEKPIWATEFGFNAYLPGCTELNQAWRMVKGFVLGISEGVRVMIVHNGYHYLPDGAHDVWDTGTSLIHDDRSVYPGFVAYGVMTRQLYKSHYVGRLRDLPDDCAGHVFAKGDDAIVVAWQKNKSRVPAWCKGPIKAVPQSPRRVSISPQAESVRVVDLFGNVDEKAVSPDGHIQLELDRPPVYIHLPLEGLKLVSEPSG